MDIKTVIDFETKQEIWGITDTWSHEAGYNLIESNDYNSRLYQRGTGMMLKIEKKGEMIHLEAWIAINLITRIFTLFILPCEMGIGTGGFRGANLRIIARSVVNNLLERLGSHTFVE